MISPDKTDFSFANLALVPLDGGVAEESIAKAPVKFHANTRTRTDRRMTADRRQEIRFEQDRRSGKDRRPKTSWEPGSNI